MSQNGYGMDGQSGAKTHCKNIDLTSAAARSFRPSVVVLACVFASLWLAMGRNTQYANTQYAQGFSIDLQVSMYTV